MRDLVGSLHRFFGHSGFRGGQQELVETVLDGHDLLAVMPTGSGKSLGFQLPALLLPGTTLVVSPLISLMKDQVDELNRRGIRAAALHSALSSEARRDAFRLARAGECQLLYVAPERFASDHFVRTLGEIPSHASWSTRLTACRSGAMISARIIGGSRKLPRFAGAPMAMRAVRRWLRSRRPRPRRF